MIKIQLEYNKNTTFIVFFCNANRFQYRDMRAILHTQHSSVDVFCCWEAEIQIARDS